MLMGCTLMKFCQYFAKLNSFIYILLIISKMSYINTSKVAEKLRIQRTTHVSFSVLHA
jgi:hypothetical protein